MILIVITFTAKTIHSPYRVAKSTTLTPLATSWIISILVCKEIFSTFLFFLDGLIWEPDIFLARQVKHNTNSAKRYCRFKIWTKIARRDLHVFKRINGMHVGVIQAQNRWTSLVRGTSVVRGFKRQIFSSHFYFWLFWFKMFNYSFALNLFSHHSLLNKIRHFN